MASRIDLSRYRSSVAGLLARQIEVVRDMQRWLETTPDGNKTSASAILEEDPTGAFRNMCIPLLRKARLHMIGMLRANQNNNIHSLAVQMRPILECAGQIVLVFHTLLRERERFESVFGDYLNSDFYQTFIRLTKGEVGHEHLLKAISEASGRTNKEVRSGRRLKQIDKVVPLEGGEDWYNYLSEYFCHGRGDWAGNSWRGGVSSINSDEDAFMFATLMDYLVNQVATMNIYAAWCPIYGKVDHGWIEATGGHLQRVRSRTKALRDGVRTATASPDEQGTD